MSINTTRTSKIKKSQPQIQLPILKHKILASCPLCDTIPVIEISPEFQPDKIRIQCEHCKFHRIISINNYLTYLNTKGIKFSPCPKKSCKYSDPVTAYCTKCKEYLCDECLLDHTSWISHNKNDIKKVFSIQTLCAEHSSNRVSFYCMDCRVHFCRECVAHKTHQYIKLSDIVNQGTLMDIRNKIIEAQSHINNYNTKLKNDFVTLLEEEITKVKNAYQSNLKINEKILECVQLLMENSLYITTNFYIFINLITNSQLNFNKLEKNVTSTFSNSEKVVSYFKHNFVKGNSTANISFANLIAEITDQQEWIGSLLMLKDGRLCACSSDKSIKIYNKDTFKCDISITNNPESVKYVSQFDDGRLIACSGNVITMWEITKSSYKEIFRKSMNSDWINKVIPISNNRFAFCSLDETIRVWQSKEPYKEIKILQGHTDAVRCIIQLKGKEKLVSGSWDQTIRIWNLMNYICEKSIPNVDCGERNGIIEIEDSKIIVGGGGCIQIVNYATSQVETVIRDEEKCLNSFVILDNKTILCGSETGGIFHFDQHQLVFIGENYAVFGNDSTAKKGVVSLTCFGKRRIAVGGESGAIQILEY